MNQIFAINVNNPYEGLELLEKYIAFFHVVASRSSEEYMCRKVTFKRHMTTFLLNLSLLITGIRCIIIGSFDNENVKIICANFNFVFARPILFSYMIALLFIGSAIAGNVF